LINFISNTPRALRSGGFSATSAAIYEALCKLDNIHYVGPINPPVIFHQKVASKLLRTLGSQGNFFAFSRERLQAFAKEVCLRCSTDARLDFFHGFTPWILTNPTRPYVTWSDCTFHDYVNIYHRRELFRPADLERIERAEARWLRRAQCVAFSSRWAAKRSVEHYGLDESSIRFVGIFGEVELPEDDEYRGGKQFAFISTDFKAKGGPTVIEAFRRVRKRHPDASLIIVGAPPCDCVADPNVVYAGYLRKELVEEHKRFCNILAQTRALVHPTRSDTTAMVIIEAGYFGCPAISVRKFAIPERIEHEVTGLLVDDAFDVIGLANAMNWVIEQESEYIRMRQHARAKAHNDGSKYAFESKIQALVAPLIV
jgi:glycosyltransferase involved in cell wall biosynthesis